MNHHALEHLARELDLEVESSRNVMERVTNMRVRLHPPELAFRTVTDNILEDSVAVADVIATVLEGAAAELHASVMRRLIADRVVPLAPRNYEEAMWFEWFGQKMLELAAPLIKATPLKPCKVAECSLPADHEGNCRIVLGGNEVHG